MIEKVGLPKVEHPKEDVWPNRCSVGGGPQLNSAGAAAQRPVGLVLAWREVFTQLVVPLRRTHVMLS